MNKKELKAEITRLQEENETLHDALHRMANEYTVILGEKDLAMIHKCQTCKYHPAYK